MNTRLLLLLCILVPTGLSTAVQAQQTGPAFSNAEDAARRAAEQWLQQFDAGALTATWTEAAALLRETMSEEQWQERGAQARDRLGAFRSRRLFRTQRRDTLQQAPEAGPFFLLRYRSAFAAGLYVETVLVVQEEEGWHVGGYEVAPMAAAQQQAHP